MTDTSVQEIVAKVKEALDHRESFDCDSQEFEKADEAVNEILYSIKPEDIAEFNKLFNETNHRGK